MISIDTETTGLWFKHGTQTFAVGIYNGTNYSDVIFDINTTTRQRVSKVDFYDKKEILKQWDSTDIICIHNAKFDVKALVNLDIFHWSEPYEEKFWSKILDTTILAHLHNNIDKRNLKFLSRKYLDTKYEEVDELDKIVNKCRTFVRSRKPNWLIAEFNKHPSIKPAAENSKWNKMDMWLPAAIYNEFPKYELEDFFCYSGSGKNKQRNNFDINTLLTILPTYLKADCINTYELAEGMLANCIAEHGENITELLRTHNQVLHVTYKMEDRGITLHHKEYNEAIENCNKHIESIKETMYKIAPITEYTPSNLANLLYTVWELPCFKKTKVSKADSTDIEAITKLKVHVDKNNLTDASQFLCCYIALKKYSKKLEYLLSYDRASINGKIFPSLNITGTNTLRFSSSDPNEQNISKITNPYEDSEFEDISKLLETAPNLRGVFGPPPGKWWISNDYSQLQLRIFAVVTNEQEMIDKLNKGYDAHDIVAQRIFQTREKAQPSKVQRTVVKAVNFGFIFGASPSNIEKSSGVDGLWDTVCEMFPNAHNFIEETKQLLKTQGVIHTVGGYPLDVPMKLNPWKGIDERAAHAAVCYIIQGTEGEIVKHAMYLTDTYLTQCYTEGHLVMQVHDEINFEVPNKLPIKHARALKELMEQAALKYNINAPVNSEIITHSWNKGKEIKL